MAIIERFFWNELLTDSDSSSSEEEGGLRARGIMVLRPRVRNFVEEVVDSYTDAEFRENFRMNRVTSNHVLSLIIERISTNIIDKGRHTITPRVQLYLALWYFGTPDSFRSICGRFNVGKATALRTVRRVAEALLYIAPNFILWPTNDYLEEVKNGFQQMGFPNTIGAIDGTHIKIPKPKNHGNSYVNRKSYPSIILQAVCDNTLKFTHCYAGEVGAHHDASVLRRSEIWSFMIEDRKFPNDTHLIGDKAYPCLPQIMTPYKDNGHLTNSQKQYNFLLSRARSTIERAFGLLKKRFKCLGELLDVRSSQWRPKYIVACCVLHNICILQNDVQDMIIDNIENHEEEDDVHVPQQIERARQLMGRAKRDRICQELNEEFI